MRIVRINSHLIDFRIIWSLRGKHLWPFLSWFLDLRRCIFTLDLVANSLSTDAHLTVRQDDFFSIGRARLNKSWPRDGKQVILRRYRSVYAGFVRRKVNFPQPPGTSGKPGGRGRGGHNYGAMQSNDRNIRTRKELEKQCITFGWKIEQTRWQRTL
jgi:hypothetical protein